MRNPLATPPSTLALPRSRYGANPAALCALTAGAGGLTLVQAATVQIDLGHIYSTASPDALKRDLTGDGIEDISTWNLKTYSDRIQTPFSSYSVDFNGLALSGAPGGAGARFAYYLTASGATSSRYFYAFVVDGVNSTATSGAGPTAQSRSGFVEIRFTDARINGGAETCGFLQLRASNVSQNEHEIELVRLVFDDSSTNCPAVDLLTNYSSFVPPQVTTTASDPRIGQLQKELKRLERKLRRARAKARRSGVRKSVKPASLVRQLKPVNARLARKIKRLQRQIKRTEQRIASLGG